MGMFDYVRCAVPLPIPGFENELFQTKDLECFMDTYEIRADGTLWGEDYEIEDRSDPNAEGLEALIGCMTRVNIRPKQITDYTGEIDFYTTFGHRHSGWVTFKAVFDAGNLKGVSVDEYKEADPTPTEVIG